MMDWFFSILGADVFQTQASCLANDRIMMVLFAAFDVGSTIAFAVIGIALLLNAKRIGEVSPPAFRLYGVFFLVCSVYRAICVMTLFVGAFRLKLFVNAAIFGTSAAIAVYTILRLRARAAREGAG